MMFGDFLVQSNLISEEVLDNALLEQEQMKLKGKNIPIGEFILDLGLITHADLHKALADYKIVKGN